MREYPSMANSRKIPEVDCIAFEKLDGSNFRAKWSPKKSFHLFGTRTQLVDESTAYWGDAVRLFKDSIQETLDERLLKLFGNEKSIIVYAEYYGEKSFAGRHEDEPHKIIPFDIYFEKSKKYMLPQDFVKELSHIVEIPKVVYRGILSQDFIQRVRENEFNLHEGVICKGTKTAGNFSGGVLMCKIKTHAYLEKLKTRYGDDWIKYAE